MRAYKYDLTFTFIFGEVSKSHTVLRPQSIDRLSLIRVTLHNICAAVSASFLNLVCPGLCHICAANAVYSAVFMERIK